MKNPVYSRRAAGALILGSMAAAAFGETLPARTATNAKKATAAAGAAPSAPWPTRPVRLLLGFPPGLCSTSPRACSPSPCPPRWASQ
jgi:hypothetical protein